MHYANATTTWQPVKFGNMNFRDIVLRTKTTFTQEPIENTYT